MNLISQGDLNREDGVLGRWLIGHATHGGLAVLPYPIQAGERRGIGFDRLDEGQRPHLQQRRPPGQGFSHLVEERDLCRPGQEEAAGVAPVGEQLHRIEMRRPLRDPVEDDDLGACPPRAPVLAGHCLHRLRAGRWRRIVVTPQ